MGRARTSYCHFFVAQIKIKLYFMRLMKLFRMNKIFVVGWKICLNTGTAFWQCGNITTGVFVIIIFKRGSMEIFVKTWLNGTFL